MRLRTNIAVLVRKPFAAFRTAVSKPEQRVSIPVDPFPPDKFVATDWTPLVIRDRIPLVPMLCMVARANERCRHGVVQTLLAPRDARV